MVDRRLPLLDATRIIKARRRIVLANKAFQRQLVGFARTRGLLGDLPRDEDHDDDDEDDDDGGRLSGRTRRLTLRDRASDGVDWRFNGLHVDLGNTSRRLHTLSAPYKSRSRHDWWSSFPRVSDDPGALLTRDGRALTSTSGRYDYVTAATNFSPYRGAATRSRETDDVVPSYVSPRQYRATKSATSLLPGSSSSRPTRAPASLHSRSSSASRFSLGFL